MIPRFVKRMLTAAWYRPGSTHRILIGPMRGMIFKCSDNTGLAALYSGNERANQAVYSQVVRPGDTVIDAGANWGVHALYLARLVGESGQVHAFEPHPQVVEELGWHISHNHLDQVTVHPYGLLDRECSIPFVLGDSSKTSHIASGSEAVSDERQVNVRFRTLDSLVAELSIAAVRLIKIDVEGAEGRTLQGAASTIQKFRPHLVVELHSPEQDLEVARTLTNWGYKLNRVEGPELLYLDRPWPAPNGVWGTLHAVPQ